MSLCDAQQLSLMPIVLEAEVKRLLTELSVQVHMIDTINSIEKDTEIILEKSNAVDIEISKREERTTVGAGCLLS